ncbi:MAG: HDOD domain-containing protein [Actinobacteria bacterium]|nr:HDOD domain-containing protein [Thermoleophilia bacterium]MCB9011485.1 HDOD domain-containing protein [Actinomycetota bacterium]
MTDASKTNSDARLTRAIDALGNLPVLSGTVARVVTLVDDPESSTGQLVSVMESDEAFAANLLRFANSAHNARPVRASTIRQAVTLVGRAAVKRLAIEAATYRFLEQVPGNGSPSRGHMHVHAVAVGSTAAAIAEHAGVGMDVPHLAGLLHDVGKLVMPLAFGDQAVDDLASRFPGGVTRAAAERDRFGSDHAIAGGMLARKWGLPREVADAIRDHHGTHDGAAAATREVACVQLANAIVGLLDGRTLDADLTSRALTRLGMDAQVLDEVAEAALSGHGVTTDVGLGEQVMRLEELARVDDLTGVLNRRAWLQAVRAHIAEDDGGSVMLLDIDNFKQVNDRHGHRMGDLLLVEVARVLNRHGEVGRLGGDEFGLWLSIGGDSVADATRAIQQTLEETFGGDSGLEGVGVSLGVVPVTPGADPIELLEQADEQLYRRKRG